MEFLEEKLFGLHHPVSANLLSLSQSINLAESRQVLSEFYEKHKDRLDASYKVTTKNEKFTSITIRDSVNVPSCAVSVSIYVLAPARASDTAVLAEVGGKMRSLQLHSSISQLKKSGICVNPLLDTEFKVVSRTKVFGPLTKSLSSKSNGEVAEAASEVASTNSTDPSESTEFTVSTVPAEPEIIVKPEVSETLPQPGSNIPTKAKKTSKTEAKPKGASQISFAKTEKSEALKSARRIQRLPVNEKVVLSNDQPNESDEDEVNLSIKRETELSNLKNLYDEDSDTKLKEEHSDEEGENNSEVEIPDAEYSLEMDMEPIMGSDLSSQADSGPKNETDVTESIKNETDEVEVHSDVASEGSCDKVEASIAGTGIDDGKGTSYEGGAKRKAGLSNPVAKRSKKVLKRVITSIDEEGFEIYENMLVDEEVQDDDDLQDGRISSTFQEDVKTDDSLKAPEQSEPIREANVANAANSGDGSINPRSDETVKKAAKNKATVKKGNQTSLMNFFKSK